VDGNKLVLPTVGNKGTAEVTYHTFKYDDQAQEIGALNKKVEITAVEAVPATVDGFKYTFGGSAPNWDKDTLKNSFSVSDSVNAYFYFTDSNKSDVTSQYSVVSSDDSVLVLPEQNLTDKITAISVAAVKAGSAYVNVKKDGKIVTSLPVVITAERKLTNVTLGVSSLTLSNAVSLPQTVTVKAVDQYGDEMSGFTTTVTSLTKPNGAADLTVNTADVKNVTVDANGKTAGTYVLKFEVEKNGAKVTRTLSVNVVATTKTTTDATDLRLVLSSSEVDLAIADDATTDNAGKTVTAKVVAYDKGAQVGVVGSATYEVNGTATGSLDYADVAAGELTINAVSVTSGSAMAVKNLEAGKTYTVKATANGKTFSGSFTVKDTQASAAAKINKKVTTQTIGSSVSDIQAILNECVVISYGDTEYKTGGSPIVVNDAGGAKVAGNAVYVGTVKVVVTNVNGVKYVVPVTINTTFTR
ncbi:MAG: hypothetical protein NC242_00040, partial [Roseburia sp.]|nr:hypothetical protein [Roseburia sp.]MCM1431903.1 hypothetical protein [Muribaculaceae bacterium]